MKKTTFVKRLVCGVLAAAMALSAAITASGADIPESKGDALIDIGACAVVSETKYTNEFYMLGSSWSRWEAVSAVSQFKDAAGNVYFAHLTSDNKLVVKRINSNLSTKTMFTVSKKLEQVGTVIADDKYFYVVWGAGSGTGKSEIAIMVTKYDASGKEMGSAAYTRDELDAVVPFDAGNCDAVISNGVLYCLFAKEMFSGHQNATSIAVKTASMAKTTDLHSFWCSHSFGQRVAVDSSGGVWYLNHGDCYPRAFLVTGPDGVDREVFHFYCSKQALDDFDMYIVNETKASIGGLVSTSNGMFVVGASVKSMTASGYDTQPRNIFITSADGSFNLPGAQSRTGTVFGDSYTDKNIKWLTNYTASDASITCVQAVATDEDDIVIIWEETNGDVFYMILDKAGNIYQKAAKLPGVHLNSCETPIYSNGTVYWLANGSKEGVSIYSLDVYALDRATFYYGDANTNGRVDARDASLILSYSARLYKFESKLGEKLADINHDGRINARDASMALSIAAGLRPAEKF